MALIDMIRGFTVETEEHKKLGKPIEDSFAFDKKRLVLAVADGVTRDKKEKPSPAREVADMFTETFVETAEATEEGIRKSIEKTNEIIGKYNKKHFPNPDYTMLDLAGCVAAGAMVTGNKVYYCSICDCGVAIFDKNGKLKFRTENDGPEKYDKAIWVKVRARLGKDANWGMHEARRMIRSQFRNNPKESDSFGVLTGQKEAAHYFKIGNNHLSKGDILFVYSDGLEHTVFSNEFSERVKKTDFKGIRQLCQANVNGEGTLVIHNTHL